MDNKLTQEYLELFKAVEKAIDKLETLRLELIEGERRAEEAYLKEGEKTE